MYNCSDYVFPSSLEEAYALLTKSRRNRIIAGGMWLRMSSVSIGTLIDLSNLDLDKAEKTDVGLKIGAMVSLGSLVDNESVPEVLIKSVSHIVGTQFRNNATIGGSVFARFGFSDPLCALLALDAKVVLYKQGVISLEEFISQPNDRDILTHIIIPDAPVKASYQSLRRTKMDFAFINLCAVKQGAGDYRISVGARPHKAVRCREAESYLNSGDISGALEAVKKLTYGTNRYASADYRRDMACLLLKQAMEELK